MYASVCVHIRPSVAMFMLNGHEWVENHKQTPGLSVIKESNCFTSYIQTEKSYLKLQTP